MHCLITNDDGVHAKGIHSLAAIFKEAGHRLTVVAPDRERSATSHGITIHQPLRITPIDEYTSDAVTFYAVDGTPADCVKLALESLLTDDLPAIVVSGINRGPNLGTDVLYSGTVSAAAEAVVLGVPAIAVSLTSFEGKEVHYKTAARFALQCADQLLRKGIPEDTLLNINVPATNENAIGGVRITKLGSRRYKNTFECRVDPTGRKYYWMSGELVDIDNDEDTDVMAIKNGYISVTPIHFDLTNYRLIAEIRRWQLALKKEAKQ